MNLLKLFPFIIIACLLQSCASNEANEDEGIRALKEQKAADEILKGGVDLRKFEAPRQPLGTIKP